ADRVPGQEWMCVCRGGPCALRSQENARLRQALEALFGRNDCRCARGNCTVQKRSNGFCAVEAVKGGRAGMAIAPPDRDAGAAGLAYRMLGNVMEALGGNVRHTWRGHRSGVSPP